MIDYSPHTKYTAQKIQDKVTRGAYYYAKFIIDKKENDICIESLISKLTARYQLTLTSRQRNYRLKKGIPITDLIVQDIIYENKWIFVLLFTTPVSYQHCKLLKEEIVGMVKPQITTKDKIVELQPTSWSKDIEKQDIQMIQNYYKDREQLYVVFNKPYLSLNFGKHPTELVRLSHKKYAEIQNKFYRKPNKPYSWTWRFKQQVIAQKKLELTQILNRLVSQSKKEKALYDLRSWQQDLNTYAVFRGNRQQAGRLYTFGKMFYYSRSKQKWDEADLPRLNLAFIKRYTMYAESYAEYSLRRYVYVICREELPREISISIDWDKAGIFIENNID